MCSYFGAKDLSPAEPRVQNSKRGWPETRDRRHFGPGPQGPNNTKVPTNVFWKRSQALCGQVLKLATRANPVLTLLAHRAKEGAGGKCCLFGQIIIK